MAYSNQILRFKSESTTRFDYPIDIITGQAPSVYANNTLNIQVGIFDNAAVVDVAHLASAVLEIKVIGTNNSPPSHTATPVASDTVSSFDNTLTTITWNNFSKQHIAFSLTDTEMDITPGDHWISCYIVTSSGTTVVLFAGPLKILNPGTTSGL